MNNSFKSWLKTIIVLGLSLFLLPTIADILGRNFQERNFILSFFSNTAGVFQILGLIFSISFGVSLWLVKLKEKKSQEILSMADQNDPIWDLESLKYHTRFIFYKVQSSLNNRDTRQLINYATPEFISWLNNTIKNQTTSVSNEFDVIDTRIIGCQDYLNNDKDKFVGYIFGNMLSSENEVTSSKTEFSEIYHFIRVQNDWVLNEIDSPSIWNILSSSSKIED